MSYDNVLYFAVSRDFDDKDKIYGKSRFAAYNTVNPSYRYVAVRYNQSIIEGSKNQYLDNYINQTVFFKNSTMPLVNFKYADTSNMYPPTTNSICCKYTDWFSLNKHAAKNILSYMIQLNHIKPYNKPVPLDNIHDYIAFVQAICMYLQIHDKRLVFNTNMHKVPPVLSLHSYSSNKVKSKGCLCTY
jgi:hypothetical protein